MATTDPELDAAVEKVGVAARNLLDAVGKERLSRRISMGVLALVLVAMGGFWRYDDVNDCQSANNLRGDVRRSQAILVGALVGEDPPPELVERAEAFLRQIDAAFPDSDCPVLPL